MMTTKIKVKNVDALRLCQAATADKDYQAIFRGVLIQRDGTIVGSDGFCLAHSKDAVEWSEGEGDSVVLQFEKQIPRGVKSASIELHGNAGVCHYLAGRVTKAMAVNVIEGSFPQWDRAVGVGTEDCTILTQRNVLNPELMVRLMKPLGNYTRYAWCFRKSGDIAYMTVDDKTEAVIVCLRDTMMFSLPYQGKPNQEIFYQWLDEYRGRLEQAA
jgi:hypothetical protein